MKINQCMRDLNYRRVLFLITFAVSCIGNEGIASQEGRIHYPSFSLSLQTSLTEREDAKNRLTLYEDFLAYPRQI